MPEFTLACPLLTRAARAAPQAFLAVLERMKQAAGPVIEGNEL